MIASVLLATAAAARPSFMRPPTALRLTAALSTRPPRTRRPLACETSFARVEDGDAKAPFTRAPKPPPPPELPPTPNGIVVAYKPLNWTSFDVVAKARGCMESDLRAVGHEFRRRSRLKVGHGGTLDPMAEGLLVLGVGTACRELEGYLKGGKAYRATAKLGEETDTQDATGAVIREGPISHVTLAELQLAAAALTGTIMQRPPIYSALRRDGKRLHELAREGKVSEEDVPKREATVYSMDVTNFDEAQGTFDLSIRCGGGTYVRTLIVDLARAVGSAAHMTALVRTQVGPFSIEESRGAEDWSTVVTPLREESFGDSSRYYAAIEESAVVLEKVDARRAAAEAAAGGGAAQAA